MLSLNLAQSAMHNLEKIADYSILYLCASVVNLKLQ